MDPRFNISCSLYGHQQDVKDIAPLYEPAGAFITVSRDITSRVWVQNESDPSYHEGLQLGGHENFVSCVCVLPPDSDHPQGLILTGSNDHKILAYTINSPAPIFKLAGHTNTVCALAGGKFGMLVSGSWDHTARIWNKQEHVMTLTGHEASVWCVAILPGNQQVLTGSADKTLRLWHDGKVKQIFKGHVDCIRGVAIMDPNHFLSCSNDATVRLWELSGTCLQTFSGHASYIYSVACLGPNLEFASSGEDRTVRIWRGGECVQTIPHPTQSVWSVCALPNGDIATGGSDGVVRIFTQDAKRIADPQVIAEFEESVAKSSIPAQIGDIKTEDLLGPEALNIPGRREGQTLMIKRKNTIEAYQWSQSQAEWIRIGEVVGGNSSDGKEETFEGQKYDHVFDVSLSEGQPSLKLPYNLSEDPYMAAHKFLERNDLSPLFLDQVAAFIQQQVGTVTIGETASSYVDPFTGSSRYMAGNEQTPNTQSTNSFGPWNGVTNVKSGNGFFPEKAFLKFKDIKVNVVLDKLREFMKKVDDEEIKIDNFESILARKNEFPKEACRVILKLLNWPSELLFPVLDIMRYVILDDVCFEAFITLRDPPEIIRLFCILIGQSDNVRNQFLTVRALCNMFQHESGRKIVLDSLDILLETIDKLKFATDKTLQVAISSFFVNISVLASQSSNDSLKSLLISNVAQALSHASDEEATFRYTVAMGTLATNNELCVAVVKSLGIDDGLRTFLSNHPAASDKLKRCIDCFLSVIS